MVRASSPALSTSSSKSKRSTSSARRGRAAAPQRRRRWRELVIGGGGMNGLVMLGAVQRLQECGALRGVRRFIGTSIGSVLCTLLVLGYRAVDILGVLRGVHFDSFDEVDGNNLLAFFDTFGMMTAQRLMAVVRAFMRVRGVAGGTTCQQLHARTQGDLVLTGFNVSRGRTDAFSHETHPNMSVLAALEISCGVPFIFRPIMFDGDMYVDGGFVDITAGAFVRSRRRAIVLQIDVNPSGERVVPTDIFDYTMLLTSRVYERLHRDHGLHTHRKMHVLPLRARSAYDIMNFRMDDAYKVDLYQYGYEQTVAHAETHDIRPQLSDDPASENNTTRSSAPSPLQSPMKKPPHEPEPQCPPCEVAPWAQFTLVVH